VKGLQIEIMSKIIESLINYVHPILVKAAQDNDLQKNWFVYADRIKEGLRDNTKLKVGFCTRRGRVRACPGDTIEATLDIKSHSANLSIWFSLDIKAQRTILGGVKVQYFTDNDLFYAGGNTSFVGKGNFPARKHGRSYPVFETLEDMLACWYYYYEWNKLPTKAEFKRLKKDELLVCC
jgi:hypothetical protein